MKRMEGAINPILAFYEENTTKTGALLRFPWGLCYRKYWFNVAHGFLLTWYLERTMADREL